MIKMKRVLFFMLVCFPCILKAQYSEETVADSYKSQMLLEYQYSDLVPFSLRFGEIDQMDDFSSFGVYVNLDFLSNDLFKTKWERDPECREYYDELSICGLGFGVIYDPNHWVGFSTGATYLCETEYMFSDNDSDEDSAYHGVKLNGMARLILKNLVVSIGGNFIVGENHGPKLEGCWGVGIKF